VQREGDNLVYKRKSREEEVAKIILSDNPEIIITPVEPVNKPKEITPYLLIEFEESLVIAPATTKRILLTFPIEIGVFLSNDKDHEVIDLIALTNPKYSLYGDPHTGVLCKYWKSGIHSSMPSLNNVLEGVFETTITNSTDEWVTMTKAVFNAYGMKIYYSDSMVSMKATIEIRAGENAATAFEDEPLQKGMNKALEVYTISALAMTTTKFVMEMGL
jgi:hypothetical protein